MRTLKYAILGLLSQQPMTGYDIAKEFSTKAFANFWYATHGQIYPEMRKLVDEGLVEYDIVIQGKALEKKLYTITDAGREDFRSWLLQDEDLPQTPKDVFRLRTYFSEFYAKDDFIQLLYEHVKKHQFKRDSLLHTIRTIYPEKPAPMTREHGDYMVLDGAIIREQTYILWLYRCLADYGEDIPEEDLQFTIYTK